MPEIFGLHDNANITFAQNETFALFGAILQLQPKSSSMGGQSREEVGSSKVKGQAWTKPGRPVLPTPGATTRLQSCHG